MSAKKVSKKRSAKPLMAVAPAVAGSASFDVTAINNNYAESLRIKARAGELVPCVAYGCLKRTHAAQWIMFPDWTPRAVCDRVKKDLQRDKEGGLPDSDFEALPNAEPSHGPSSGS